MCDAVAKNCIALAPAFTEYQPMLARVLSVAVNGIEAFPVEVEVNSDWGIRLSNIIMYPSPRHGKAASY